MSIRSEVVALLDPLFSGRVAADESPPGGLVRPYARVLDLVSETPRMRGDGRTLMVERSLQVDVYENLATQTDALADSVVAALDGSRLAAGLRLWVTGRVRLPDPELGVSHTALMCSVARPSP